MAWARYLWFAHFSVCVFLWKYILKCARFLVDNLCFSLEDTRKDLKYIRVCVCVCVCVRARVDHKLLDQVQNPSTYHIFGDLFCRCSLFFTWRLTSYLSRAGGRRWGGIVENRLQSASLESRHFTACPGSSQNTQWHALTNRLTTNLNHIWALRWNQLNIKMIFSKLLGSIFTYYTLKPVFGSRLKFGTNGIVCT